MSYSNLLYHIIFRLYGIGAEGVEYDEEYFLKD